jgi:hypothetical protein
MTANSISTPHRRKGSAVKPTSKSKDASAAEAPPYEPTRLETEALNAYVAAHAKSAPRLKVAANGVGIDHPDPGIGYLSLLKAIGSRDYDFLRRS